MKIACGNTAPISARFIANFENHLTSNQRINIE